MEDQRQTVVKRAQQESGHEIYAKSKGPIKVARGTSLSVRLKLEGLIVENPEDTILWVGEIGNATFSVLVPSDAKRGTTRGLVTIHINGMRVARLDFVIEVGRPSLSVGYSTREARYCKAFASYASEDLKKVLARIQGIQKVAPELQIFLDVLSLRSGQYWEQELWKVIPENDVFYLFWSEPASKSEWVEKEWRCALKTKGLEFIDPVPLVSPSKVPPPPELAKKHFNDWMLGFR